MRNELGSTNTQYGVIGSYGIVQDRTADMAYTNVLLIGIAFKFLDLFVAITYIFVDYKWLGQGMTLGEKQRIERETVIIAEGREDEDPLTRRRTSKFTTFSPSKFTTFGGLTLLGCMMVSAWAVFINNTIL